MDEVRTYCTYKDTFNQFPTHFVCFQQLFSDKFAKDSMSSSSGKPQSRERILADSPSSLSSLSSSPTTATVTMSSREKYEAKKSIVILIAIFSISLIAMFYVYLMFPELDA